MLMVYLGGNGFTLPKQDEQAVVVATPSPIVGSFSNHT